MSLTLSRRGKSVLLSLKLESAEQTQRTVWSAASSKTGPGRGHLFSADPEARGRGDPLREHTVTEHLLPLTGAARQLLPALPPPSFFPSFPLPARHPCHPCPALPAPASPWALGHVRHGPRSASAPVGAVAGQRAERRCPAPPRWVRRRCPAQPRQAPMASRGSSGPPVLLERAGEKKLQDEFSGGGMALAGDTGSVADWNNPQGSPLPVHDGEFGQCLPALGEKDGLCPVRGQALPGLKGRLCPV